MTIPPSRAELAELFREDDRHRIEHRAFMAQPEAQARALMQRNGDAGGLIYKTRDDALQPAPQPQPEPFDEATSTAPNFFDDVERNEEFAETMAYVIAELRREWRRDHAVEIAKLAAKLDVVLQLIKSGNATTVAKTESDVIDLPSGILRRRNHAAA
jgi:hypothetical protein